MPVIIPKHVIFNCAAYALLTGALGLLLVVPWQKTQRKRLTNPDLLAWQRQIVILQVKPRFWLSILLSFLLMVGISGYMVWCFQPAALIWNKLLWKYFLFLTSSAILLVSLHILVWTPIILLFGNGYKAQSVKTLILSNRYNTHYKTLCRFERSLREYSDNNLQRIVQTAAEIDNKLLIETIPLNTLKKRYVKNTPTLSIKAIFLGPFCLSVLEEPEGSMYFYCISIITLPLFCFILIYSLFSY